MSDNLKKDIIKAASSQRDKPATKENTNAIKFPKPQNLFYNVVGKNSGREESPVKRNYPKSPQVLCENANIDIKEENK